MTFSVCTRVRKHSFSAVMGLYECIRIHSYEFIRISVCAPLLMLLLME